MQRTLQWLCGGEGHLKEQIFRGGIWLLMGNVVTRIAGFVKLAILARLLTPTDFGLLGIALLLLNWLEQFSQTGFSKALIRNAGDIEPYLNTVWTVQVIRATGLAAVLLLGAPVAVWFFASPEAVPIIRALAPLVLLQGLTNPAVIYLTRQLDFQRIVQWNMWQVGSSLVVSIPLAFVLRNVWALILAMLVGQAVSTMVSYRLHAFRPRLCFDRQRAREMTQFGKWIFWRNVLVSVVGSLDSLLVGKLLGVSALGLYQVARRLALLPRRELIQILQRLTFPAFAQIRQHERLRRACVQVLSLTLLLILPIAALLLVFPELIIRTLLGERWVAVVPLVQILTIGAGLQTLMGIAVPLFEGIGRPDVALKTWGVRLALSTLLLYPSVRMWGINGAALALIGTELVLVVLQFYLLRRLIGLRILQGVATCRLGLIAALPMLVVGFLTIWCDLPMPGEVGLGLTAVVGSGVLTWRFLRPYLRCFRSGVANR